jgi:hypothetical protein
MFHEQEKYMKLGWRTSRPSLNYDTHYFQKRNNPGKREHNIQRVKDNIQKMTGTCTQSGKQLGYMDCGKYVTWGLRGGQMPLQYCFFLTWLHIWDMSVDIQVSFLLICNRNINEICNLLGFYATQHGSSVRTFWDNLSVPSSFFLDYLTLEDGTDRLSQNVGTKLPFSFIHSAVCLTTGP